MEFKDILEKSEAVGRQAKAVWESDEVQSKVTLAKNTAKNLVEKYPVGSLAGALLIGYIAGKLLKADEDE